MGPWFGAGLACSALVMVVVLIPELRSSFPLGKLSQNNYMCMFTFILSGDWHELNCLHKECKPKTYVSLAESKPRLWTPVFSSTSQTEGKHKNSQNSQAGDSYSGANLKRPTRFEEEVKQFWGGRQDRVSMATATLIKEIYLMSWLLLSEVLVCY